LKKFDFIYYSKMHYQSRSNMSKNSNSNNGNGPSSNTRSKNPKIVVDFTEIDKIGQSPVVVDPNPKEDASASSKPKKGKSSSKSKNPIHHAFERVMQSILSESSSSSTKVADETNIVIDETDESDDESSMASWEEEYDFEEVEFLEGLGEVERTELIMLEQVIRSSKKPEMPVRFKILKSEIDDGVKYLILKKLDQIGCHNDHKIHQWVDGLATIPFNKVIKSSVSIQDGKQAVFQFLKQANACMNKCIYGHHDAKAQILEYIAQYITNPRSNGKCLALQGPPGNGKTTLVRNGIAKAIGRPFAQISLGGANDVSVLTGHDFTYEGSQCGRICSILRQTGVMNPIFYFDELDKVSSTHKGEDIYNFLCHLTDFSQNHVYHDKYYDGIDLDLSKAIFIFSFNDITKINPILLDRLHVIHTKGFNTPDKTAIAKEFLIPELMQEIGLNPNDIIFEDEVITDIINNHCRDEQGVRKLRRILEGLLTKLNILQFSKSENESLELPYDIPDLTFPLKINHKIVSKLLVDESSAYKPHVSMYL
jgi:ATP-dependent Lon protease